MSENTKLQMRRFTGDFCESYAQSFARELTARFGTFPTLHYNCDYDFPCEVPVVVTEDTTEEYTTKPGFFSNGGEVRKRVVASTVLLAFSRTLTNDELKNWRFFKLGYLCRTYTPTCWS
jgi:hypothetical protein